MKYTTLSGGVTKQPLIIRFLRAKKNIFVEAIAALFILLFLYTAINKSLEINRTVDVLKKISFLSRFSVLISWGVVILEYIIAVLLFIPKTRRRGLYASLILMLTFSIYISLMVVFISDLPCSCGGVISQMNWMQHLAFNGFFIILGLVAILLDRIKGYHEQSSVIYT